MIGEMKNLEILSLNSSEFKQLSREIRLLTHLRMLDLSNCKKLSDSSQRPITLDTIGRVICWQ